MSDFPLILVRCPKCEGTLSLAEGAVPLCGACKNSYPSLGKAPWLFAFPDHSLSFWRDNLKLQLQQIDQEISQIQKALQKDELLVTQKQRLKKWAEAKKEFARSLERTLLPLSTASQPSLDTSLALRDKIPMTQRLGSYLENIYRDWAWGDENGENQAALEILKELIEPSSIPQLLVLGAGACRLAYDFHRTFKVSLTLASDINPLYLLIAQEVIEGNTKPLYEFPLAPKDGKSFFVRRELKAPAPLKEGFHFLFADGMNPPFPRETFEALLTPWFIDIVPQDPVTLFKRFNFVLKPKGKWINFGSCFFNHPDFSRRYSPEEILEIAEASGFKIQKVLKKKLPYLQSPESAHGRVEQTFSFCAEKVAEVEQPEPFTYLPQWLLDPTLPIPKTAAFMQFAAVHGFYAQIVSAIDGRKSLESLAKEIGPQVGLTPEDAIQSFGRFLTKVHETGILFS